MGTERSSHTSLNPQSAEFLKFYIEMEWVNLQQLLLLKTLMVGHGGSSAHSYLADPTSPPTVL